MAEQDRFTVESRPEFTPFWRRMPSFFRYPMQAGTLMRIAGYSIFGGIALVIPFGGLLQKILYLVFFKYAFLIMERTASGRFDEPNSLDGKDEGDTAQVMRQYGLFAAFIFLTVLLILAFGQDIGVGLGLVLMAIGLPAGIMTIAVSRSLWQALNPLQILSFILTIGSPYLALCFLLFSLTGSAVWMQVFLATHLNSWLVLPLVSFVQFYFWLIIYHMMGYAIFQYHEELGVQAQVSFEEAEAKLSPNKPAPDPVLTRLAALIAEGKNEEAISLLREELRTNWEKNELHERYQRLLVAAGKQESALNHARDFIGKLVLEKRLFQALDLCEQSLKADPEFQLHNSDHVHELASAARMVKRQKLALDLMRRFDKRYPGHKHIPAVYLLSAQILSEHYRMDNEALKILRTLLAKFPEHALAPEARQYMDAVAKMQAV